MKLDEEGEIEWTTTFIRRNLTTINSVTQTADNGFALAGWNGSSWSWGDFWVIKLDKKGEIIWEKIFNKFERDEAFSVIQTVDLNYLVIGEFSDYAGHRGIWIIKLNTEGKLLWEKIFDLKTGDINTLIQTGKDCYVFFIDIYKSQEGKVFKNCIAIRFDKNE